MSNKIITFTLNTAVDYIIQVKDFNPGKIYQSESAVIVPAGKGINVARTVASLGYKVIALGFIGRKSAGMFESVADEFITTDFIQVPGMTRINVTLVDSETDTTTHIRNPGYQIEQADMHRLIHLLNRYVTRNDLVILSGSLPDGSESDTYQKLIHKIHERSGIAFLDTSGEALKRGIQAVPDIIKPNQDELTELSEMRLENIQDIILAMKKLSKRKINTVLVSLGSNGLLAYHRGVDKIYQIVPPNVSIKKSGTEVGCGDALVGGYAVGLLNQVPHEERLKYAVACGIANLATKEPGRVNKNIVDKYFQFIKMNTF